MTRDERKSGTTSRTLFAGLTGAALTVGAISVLGWTGTDDGAASGVRGNQDQQVVARKMAEMAPYDGYLKAHSVKDPPALLGGSLHVSLSQDGGGVHVALPDRRELDSNVFGTPEYPRAFGGTPAINGLPIPMRESEGGEFTMAKPMTPFGDKAVVMGGAQLKVELTDATATDGATSDDAVTFMARWRDERGNTYEVRCCEMLATRGIEYPTFGGVVTNHILHGSSRIGTALMPTEYVYAAFWGMGRVMKSGETLQAPRLVHGMLTEYVRTEGYELASDSEVTPGRRHFHLMVPPMMPNREKGMFEHSAVQTGFQLPNGKTLPFWHVMFGNVDVSATRGS